MKRLLALLVAAVGIRELLRRRAPAAGVPVADVPSPQVESLRAKLEEARAAVPPDAPEPEPESDVAGRRAEVHERARKAIDELG